MLRPEEALRHCESLAADVHGLGAVASGAQGVGELGLGVQPLDVVLRLAARRQVPCLRHADVDRACPVLLARQAAPT
eukprot:COSAG04_NODE_456_length_14055_cov_41.823660_1_plen_76_part_10